MSAPAFDAQLAFSRTLGFVTRSEAELLRGKTVAIAGLGGVGGSHLLVLTRLGIGGFHLADFDAFAVENFNRQAGASMQTVDQKKLDVMERLARDINPDLRVERFPDGVTHENLEAFLAGVDIYIDGLDFFAFEIRAAVFDACYRKGIPIVTAAPLGMGAAVLNFLPGKMSPSSYFNWQTGDSDLKKGMKFLIGLSPSLPQRHYLVDKSFVDLSAHKGPSTPMACEICAGCAGTEALKILLGRGKVRAAPRSVQYDAYQNRFYSHNVRFGNRNPLQKIRIMIALRILARKVNNSEKSA